LAGKWSKMDLAEFRAKFFLFCFVFGNWLNQIVLDAS